MRKSGEFGGTSWSRKQQPTSAFLPGKIHGQRGLASHGAWDHKESDTTEHIHTEGTSISKPNEQAFFLRG